MISVSFFACTATEPLDLALAPGSQRDVEVGRREVQPVVARLEEDVGQRRDGGLTLDDPLHGAELGQELRAVDPEIHGLPSLGQEFSI
jgi:hypothetical protein